MRWLEILRNRLRSIFFRADVERELEEELHFHAEHARVVGQEQIKEECRDARGLNLLDHLIADLRFALRLLRRNPGFSALAIATLALGIGATSAIFGVMDAVLLRPLPFPESGRLVRLWEGKIGHGPMRNVVNGVNFDEWRRRSRSFESIAAIERDRYDLTGDGQPISAPGARVSPEFFQILRVSPFLGRWFLKEEEQPGKTDRVILSYGLWQSRFGGDRGVLGRRIQVSGSPMTIVGVMPPGFTFVTAQLDLWMPIGTDHTGPYWKEGRFLTTVARLVPGVSVERASQEMASIAAQLAVERPDFDKGWSVAVVPVLEGLVEDVRQPLYLLLGAVGCLLLIACANVANLLLIRGAERTREIAVRAAIGAARGRILRQLVTESLLLATLGGILGLVFTQVILRVLPAALASTNFLPRLNTIQLDARVFFFAAAVSALTAILFGLFPAARLTRIELHDALKQGARGLSTGHRRFRQTFVTVQIALALTLLAGAGLLVRSFARLTAVDPGFHVDRLLTMNVGFSPVQFKDDRQRADYVARILREAGAVPGVRAIGSTHVPPLEDSVSASCFDRAGQAPPTGNSPTSDMLVISPGYLNVMGIPLVSGRDFRWEDRIGSPGVVMVTQSLAQQVFPGENALGRQLNLCWDTPNPVEIVGVTRDIRQLSLEKPPHPTIFIPVLQAPNYGAGLMIRTAADPGPLTRAVEEAIHRVNPDQAISEVHTMDEILERSVAQPRFQSTLLAIFAAMAMLLSAIGIYAVVAYSVTQRTREIGIRVVLGATRGGVARLVVREGLRMAAFGILLGLGGALAFSRLLRDMLFEIAPGDPPTLIAVSLLLGAIAVLATLAPARQATRVEPVEALRSE